MKKIIGFLIILLLVSCKEEEILTSGEKIGNDLQVQTDKLQIETAVIYEWSTNSNGFSEYRKVNEGNFSISGQFLMVDNSPQVSSYYNLTKLYRYLLFENRKEIHLYFK